MSMRFAYDRINSSTPILSLGGRFSRPRPMLPITLIGPSGSHLMDGLIDSGSDETIFPEYVAGIVGIDLAGATGGCTHGIGAGSLTVRFADVTLRIAGSNELHEWPAVVSFAPLARRTAILGFAGFLQYFTTTLHGDLEFVELTVNALYPGS
jgi:hypothetical protein